MDASESRKEQDLAFLDIASAGNKLVEAKRAWAEAFIRFKMSQPPKGQKIMTDNQARAMADIEVSVTRAEIDYELAKRLHDATQS